MTAYIPRRLLLTVPTVLGVALLDLGAVAPALAAAQHGKHPRGRVTYGKSLIVDPWGEVLAQCSEGEGFATARLDFAYQDKVRASLPCLTHRRI